MGLIEKLLWAIGFTIMSGVKFLTAPPIILAKGFNEYETALITWLGGIIGCYFFYYGGARFFRFTERLWPRKRKKRTFSKKNRILIRVKNKVGLWGLTLLVPIVSIPVSMLVAAKYFRNDPRANYIFPIVITVWTILITLFSDVLMDAFIN